ncbi:hypothetical protein FIU88_19065 (plasmid) [Halomonas sp. THAF12]|nr:hypothetical protein FIU88_17850 [Halomonas sp. THAF12]QFT87056.1 hypothetical protein FIU88_19065 [Halomonas sp. THAF12]
MRADCRARWDVDADAGEVGAWYGDHGAELSMMPMELVEQVAHTVPGGSAIEGHALVAELADCLSGQLNALAPGVVRAELSAADRWSPSELDDDHANRARLTWLACQEFRDLWDDAAGCAETGEEPPKDNDAMERAMPTMKTSPQLDRDLLRDAHTDLEAVRDMLREGDNENARRAVGSLLGRIEARQSDWHNQRLGDWQYRYDQELEAIHVESADGYRVRYQFDDEWLWFQCPGQDDMLQRSCHEMREPVEVLNRAEELRQEHLQEEAAHRRLSGE